MRIRAGIIGAAVAGLALSAHASIYTSMAVPGDHNGWNTAPSMTLIGGAGNVWVCTQTLSTATGSFKFVSNGDWNEDDWGGSASLSRVPAQAYASVLEGNNLGYSGFTAGPYRFTFNDSTREFRIEWADVSPLPIPSITNMALVGTFNNWAPTASSMLTNHPVPDTNTWSLSIDLFQDTAFQFKPNGTWDNQFGAPEAVTIVIPGVDIPVTNSACGKSDYTLSDIVPGTFQFSLNVSNATLTITQTATNSAGPLASVSAVGNFVAGTPPDINLEKIGGTVWRSDFNVTNAASFKLNFLGRDANGISVRYWGTTNASPLALPATGSMLSSTSNVYTNATITAPPGNYRITFDSASGAFSVQQRYTASSGVNLLSNPSFEAESFGVPDNWGVFHAQSGTQADFGAHSGNRCGILLRKTVEADPDLGNFDQTTASLGSLSGQTFRVSAAFRTAGDWQAETVRIIVEWISGVTTVRQDAVEVVGLTEEWRIHALETPVPGNNLKAKILFKYDGDPGTGVLLIDDAEARIAASRFQNFDTWVLSSFQTYSPDWAVSHGKTIYNLPASTPTGGVFISKYIEGTGNNKAVEIFNGMATAVDLAAGSYVLQQVNNGITTTNIALSGTIPAGGTLVVARPSSPGPFTNYPPDPAIAEVPLLFTNKYLTFNGDDRIVLRQGGAGGTVKDCVGSTGANPAGAPWTLYATDRTLHRKHSVFFGNTTFTPSEWTAYPKDTFTELGLHFLSLDDPNAPYLPSGYSLLLNTNAALVTPELEGGIGDVSFYARVQGGTTGSDLQLAIETTTSTLNTNWTLVETLTVPFGTTNFTLFSSFANRSDHALMRIRHVGDGSTNRIRIDDVSVGEAYAVRRTQNFADWTSFLGLPLGTYARAEWTIQNAQIGTNGYYGSLSANLYPDSGSVTSPTFEGGVGTVKFRMMTLPDETGEVRATVMTSTNNGTTWVTNGTASIAASTKLSTNDAVIAIYLPTSACVRISSHGSASPYVIDNIEIGIPSISRVLDFDDFKVESQYAAYNKDGWAITDTAIVTNLLFSGYSGRVRNGQITSPFIDAIGPFSFYYSQFSGDSTAKIKVEISSNATSWVVLNTGLSVSPATAIYSYFNTNAAYHYVRISQITKDKRVHIDQIDIGEPAPIPSCTISAYLEPTAPGPDEGFRVMASVLPLNGADVLTVTGAYRIGFGSWVSNAMTQISYGTYESPLVPPLAAGTRITYKATAWYGGVGAAPGSTSYTTNIVYSTIVTTKVLDVKRGTVWINEIFYAPFTDEDGGGGIWGDTPYNHEFIELCGVAGTSITNWKVQLLFASASDRTKNGGQAVYATYNIPAGTVLSNTANGYGFYVIGDQQLKDAGEKVNQVLTALVPTSVNFYAATDLDHVRDPSGIIRLLDDYSNVVYSLSYGAYDSGSDRLLVAQDPTTYNSNSLSLSGTGSEYDDFDWNDEGDLTIGEANTGQVLVPDEGLPPMPAWHIPGALAQTSLQGVFNHFHPLNAAQSSVLFIHYAYTNADFTYSAIGGNVHHHKQGLAGVWSIASKQNDFPGNFDTNGTGYAYLRMGPIPAYTYDRLDTIEYVIEAVPPSGSSLATAWLGSDGQGGCTNYESLTTAQQYPFQYTFPIADPIEITRMTRTNNLVVLETDGNDVLDPIIHFGIRSTTNLLLPTHLWDDMVPQSIAQTNEQNYITLTNPPGLNRYFAIEPLWP